VTEPGPRRPNPAPPRPAAPSPNPQKTVIMQFVNAGAFTNCMITDREVLYGAGTLASKRSRSTTTR
jgi:hypothetical protein